MAATKSYKKNERVEKEDEKRGKIYEEKDIKK